MTKPKKFDSRIVISIDPFILAKLREIATAWGIGMSAAVRRMIVETHSSLFGK